MEERVVEDYGLEAIGGGDEEEDTFNDDTFGDAPISGEFDFNNEGMARLHEEFLAAGGGAGGGGGFFGDALQEGNEDFMLEAGLDAQDSLRSDLGLGMDLGFLDDPAPQPTPAPPAPAARSGLRVAGLPSNLDEEQVKQVLSHFGALATFTLKRGAGAATSVALLSYQDPAVAKDACASLHGIPLGGR